MATGSSIILEGVLSRFKLLVWTGTQRNFLFLCLLSRALGCGSPAAVRVLEHTMSRPWEQQQAGAGPGRWDRQPPQLQGPPPHGWQAQCQGWAPPERAAALPRQAHPWPPPPRLPLPPSEALARADGGHPPGLLVSSNRSRSPPQQGNMQRGRAGHKPQPRDAAAAAVAACRLLNNRICGAASVEVRSSASLCPD